MLTSTSQAPASENANVTQQNQNQSHWWSPYESWIENHWLLLTYIGAGVVFVLLVMVVLLVWRKKINKKRELILKLTVHPVKPQKSNTNIDSETVQATVAQSLQNGDTVPTIPQTQEPERLQVTIDVKESQPSSAQVEDAGVVKNNESNTKEKKQLRFAPSVNERMHIQNPNVPASSIAITMRRMNQSESNFSDIYNEMSHNDATGMQTILETMPVREMTPSYPPTQAKRDTVFSNTEIRESRRDPEFSAIYESCTESNDDAANKEHRHTHRADTQDTDVTGMYAAYPQAEMPVADEALPSEKKRPTRLSDRFHMDKIQNYRTSENQGGKSRFSRKYDSPQETTL